MYSWGERGLAFATALFRRVLLHRSGFPHTHRLLLTTLLFPLIVASQPVDAGGAAQPATDPRLQQAVAWATQQVGGPKVWIDGGVTLCDMFVENAFGVTAQYPTAYDMYLALGEPANSAQHTLAGLQNAPAGAIVFFDRNAGNFQDGHVGIFTGGGQFVGVVTGGGVKQYGVQWWNDNVSHFLGWAYPRADWPGYSKGKASSHAVSTPATPPPPPPPLPIPSPQAVAAASRLFQAQWQSGEKMARNLWGPSMVAPKNETYGDAPGGYRIVQYFDKGRMELTDPKGGTVTNGLLATELITGKMQMGNDSFQSRAPAAIPIAGDPDSPGPTYATLNGKASELLLPVPAKIGTAIGASISATGDVSEAAPTAKTDVRLAAKADTTLSAYDSTTKHNLPAAFAAYRSKVGIGVIGYAKSEPFVATVKVAGVQRQVVVQVFERRVLTYTASNPDAFKVEMGNIGQHYERWRYDT
jgi:hypothetical protein